MFENVETIKFNNKYVVGRAKDLITDFSKNTYIIKGSTGIGGTTALLNYTSNNCLIISPNVGMIKGKEGKKYESKKQLFIYSNSKDNWSDVKSVLDNDSNLIINCTPEQILKVRESDNELYNLLITYPIFVDEIHSYSIDSMYRSSLGEFMELVYNEWIACFKLSTATPNYNFVDIPKDKEIEIYKIERENEPVKQLYYSTDIKHLKRFVYDENNKGRLVVVFSNNINIHKSFQNLDVKNLTGQSLKIKLAPFERASENDKDLITDCDVLILSSSYFAGFDIDKECSIVIVSEQKNDAFKVNANNVIQAYGRCRANVHNALFINAKAKYNFEGKPINVSNSKDCIESSYELYKANVIHYQNELVNEIKSEYVTSSNYVNRAVLIAKTIELANDYYLYNDSALNELLNHYKFSLNQYFNEFEIVEVKSSIPFNLRLLALLELDVTELKKSYLTIKYNLKIKDKGSYSTKLALEYLTAYLLKVSDSVLVENLSNKRVYANEFLNSLNLFLRVNSSTYYLTDQLTSQQTNNANRLYFNENVSEVLYNFQYLLNDWYMLYAIHKVNNNMLPVSIEREIMIYENFYDVKIYNQFLGDKKNRARDVKKVIVDKLEIKGIELRNDELNWLNDVSKTIFKSLDTTQKYSHSNTRKNIKNKMINAIIFLMTKGKCNAEVKDVKNRVYSPLTQLPKALRCILPIKYVSVDLTSANPQIVDNILNTKLAMNVYANLMQKRGITRNEAKVLYNSSLNNHYQSVKDAYSVYLDAGYIDSDALRLAKMTARVDKGSFFELMTASEKILMENYQKVIPIDTYRFHDAIIMSYEDIRVHNITLVNNLDNYVYHSEFFNDSSNYTGGMCDEVFSSENGMLENRVYLKRGA